MLKFIYEKEADIPEGAKEHYEESGGKWVLKCEGAVPSSRLDEFRDNNLELKKKLEAFAGIDPVKARDLAAKADEIEASKAKTDEEVQKLIDARVAKMTEEFNREKSELQTRLDTTEGQLSSRIIDSGLIEAGTKFGLKATAHEDAIARGRSIFKIEDGKPVAYKDGEKQYGVDGQPLTPESFMEGLVKSAGHLFEPNAGTGSKGSGAGAGSNGPNPWATDSFNLSKQGEIFRENPALAKQLAAKAGKPLN